ncbi:hypothetical protein FACS189425_11010 [Clostridia bacterium]|nr:hypothetical protein FACS189425_11010 [Clostridia bacterium]
MKKKLALVLAVMMIASLGLVSALAADTWSAVDLSAAIKTAEGEASGWGGYPPLNVAIPAGATQVRVTTNDSANAFKYFKIYKNEWAQGGELKGGNADGAAVTSYTLDITGWTTVVIQGEGTADLAKLTVEFDVAGAGGGGNPKTGDNSVAIIALVALLMAGTGAVVFSRKAKKN